MSILFCCFLILSILGFVSTGYDKNLAKKRKRRIPEKTLLSIAALGGSFGVGIAMLLFRHKTAKATFLWKYFGVLLLQIFFIYFLLTLK
ncbi:DUF1294 domain-containing protein [Flavobacterium sp. F-380]|uniref:DUF1294 domain-containing protein n=1 Tax=Flavobacterium kayseriense TaxID=2764714 RepID=A0ABR7J505_9FLAO|nr:DUF1294 domain-containing protein [Flavobacterium kayseriense]MBC5840508.1 DUF1294 domain-containing protein [Flavobacterium kayseriense]MBC5846822.1 DUF1294 domain-containing protein [Flavobacterium kayseriense]